MYIHKHTHRVSLITGLEYGLEWNGQSSERVKYASSLIAVLHYKRLYCIPLQVVNMYLCLKMVTCILIVCFNGK